MTRYAGLAGRYLQQQRKRTALTIVAVILSVALITSAGVFAQSIRELGVENIRARFGGFYAQAEGFTADELERIRRHAAIDEVGTTVRVGTMPLADDLRAYVHAPDEVWTEKMSYVVADGRMPSGAGEIAVESWLFRAARRPVAVGDEITVPVVPERVGAAGEGSGDVPAIRATFEVVGLIAPDAAGISEGVAAALISQRDAHAILGEAAGYRVGFTTTGGLDIQEAVANVAESFGLADDEIYRNSALLAAMGSSNRASANDALRAVQTIVAAILVVATIGVIYNSFTISVMERIRQFGILRTVGATPRQIRRIVFRQAGVIAAIGAPIGLAAGLAAVRIVVAVFNGFSMDIGFAGVSMSYPLSAMIGGPLLGIASVYASALLPARAAGRVSPLEAVLAEGRFVKDRIKGRKSPMLSRLFGVSGKIAGQNLRRHPGRFLVTVFSIGIGVALFVTFAGFFTILNAANTNVDSTVLRGDVTVEIRVKDPEPIARDGRVRVESLPGVERVVGIHEAAGYLVLPAAQFADTEDAVDASTADRIRALVGEEGPVAELSVLGLEETGLERIRTRVISGWRSPGELSESGGVYVPEGVYEIGEVMPFVVGERVVELPVVGLADNLPAGNYNSDTAIAAIDTVRELTGKDGFTGLEVDASSELAGDQSGGELARSIEAVLGNRGDVFAYDMSAVEESGEQIGLQMSILLYGLVAVVSLIGALNIVNTITTNLILRVREFGTLRAVGMSVRQMRGMVRIESVLYGLWAVSGGGAVGVALTRLIYNNVMNLQPIAWQPPWGSLAISVVMVVGISLLSAAVPMGRISEMDIVESIRTAE
jgi:putative ABC transport system permease protein